MRQLSDEALRDWVLEARPGWQEAYHHLMHERYGGTIRSALRRAEAQYGRSLRWEEVLERLFSQLRGRTGDWSNLSSWTPEKGAFPSWLWVVALNVCRRMLRVPALQARSVSLSQTPPDSASVRVSSLAQTRAEGSLSLDALIQRLEPPCAQLLRLKYYAELKDADIGEQLGGYSREWANRQRRRCVERLADLLNDEGLALSDFEF